MILHCQIDGVLTCMFLIFPTLPDSCKHFHLISYGRYFFLCMTKHFDHTRPSSVMARLFGPISYITNLMWCMLGKEAVPANFWVWLGQKSKSKWTVKSKRFQKIENRKYMSKNVKKTGNHSSVNKKQNVNYSGINWTTQHIPQKFDCALK